ncbi:hypothetical protein O6H91_13G025100 [Diphasiastrum complanatum]|uniref:Uncharacterized protein n=1 Tax=Diphasiastrum complanatum TaxID=34168 RepID=A0ACC2BT20_DIPCM|nr:hypothetical protein O6H91_13G025100 [Diphasiastrum complanatum]
MTAMAEALCGQILGGSCESDSTTVAWASPRISFSKDFVQLDQLERGTIRVEDRKQYSTDFEFAMANSISPQGFSPSAAMLPADELISDGKLLPFEQSRQSFSSSTIPLPQLHASTFFASSSSAPSLTASRSYPSAREEESPPLSPKALKCGTRWRELFRFRTKLQYEREKENVPPDKEEKASSKLFRLFSRSRSLGSGEIDRLAFHARQLCHSIIHGNAEPFPEFKIFTDSSSPEKHSEMLKFPFNNASAINRHMVTDQNGYIDSPARSWRRRPCGDITEQASKSKIKCSCTSPGRVFQSSKTREMGSSGRRNLLKSSSFRDGEIGSRASSSRIIMKNFDKCSSSNTKIHQQAKMIRWGEYWRLADKSVSYSKVRVTPVLLNVPLCRSPSLSSVKVSKTKLMNLRHLFLPKNGTP